MGIGKFTKYLKRFSRKIKISFVKFRFFLIGIYKPPFACKTDFQIHLYNNFLTFLPPNTKILNLSVISMRNWKRNKTIEVRTK